MGNSRDSGEATQDWLKRLVEIKKDNESVVTRLFFNPFRLFKAKMPPKVELSPEESAKRLKLEQLKDANPVLKQLNDNMFWSIADQHPRGENENNYQWFMRLTEFILTNKLALDGFLTTDPYFAIQFYRSSEYGLPNFILNVTLDSCRTNPRMLGESTRHWLRRLEQLKIEKEQAERATQERAARVAQKKTDKSNTSQSLDKDAPQKTGKLYSKLKFAIPVGLVASGALYYLCQKKYGKDSKQKEPKAESSDNAQDMPGKTEVLQSEVASEINLKPSGANYQES